MKNFIVAVLLAVLVFAQAAPSSQSRAAVARWQKAWTPQIAYDKKLSCSSPQFKAWVATFKKLREAEKRHCSFEERTELNAQVTEAARLAEAPLNKAYQKVYARFKNHVKELRQTQVSVLNALANKLRLRLKGRSQNNIADFWFIEPKQGKTGGIRSEAGSLPGLAFLARDTTFAAFFKDSMDLDGYSTLRVLPVYRLKEPSDKDSDADIWVRDVRRDIVLVGFVLDLVSYNADICVAEDLVDRKVRSTWIERRNLNGDSDGVDWPSPQRTKFADNGRYRLIKNP